MEPFTIVICPGAFPLPRIYEPLIADFNERQHTAICMVQQYHPTSSTQTLPTVNPDSEYLRHSVLDPLLSEGKDIVVFAHSYGGIYAPASLEGISKQERRAKGLEGGVVAVVLCAASIARKGTTALEAMLMEPDTIPGWTIYDESTGLVTFDKSAAKAMLFHDLPDEEADKLAERLSPQPYHCFTTPTHWDPYHSPAFRGKIGYIFTGGDRIVPLEAQRTYVEIGKIERTRMLEGSSHSPHIEQPGMLADTVLELVKEITEKTNCKL
ncbi:hypothetical protein QBC37DRAFT_421473 [Rhypophila decipiens]|uniref:AB hydrolase-1 domain-containing protein n=1 Tax=Rhypophila decipiens TaxID=261697 RepID=A0AAN6Y933_9PEZI|nr:hypothetical protein QBC37DRAFT_421473 [Rhypophila decipiens]